MLKHRSYYSWRDHIDWALREYDERLQRLQFLLCKGDTEADLVAQLDQLHQYMMWLVR